MSCAMLAALGGLAVLVVGAAALILWAEREPPATPPPRAEAAAKPASAPAPQEAAPAAPRAPAVNAAEPAPAAEQAGAYPKDPAALLRAIRPLQREVADGLASLDASGRCQLRGAFVELTLETGEGVVLVREAVVKRPAGQQDEAPADHHPAVGTAEAVTDETLLRCVQQSMQGRTFRAPSAKPGRRWQTSYWQPAHPP